MNVYARYQDSVVLLAENLSADEANDFMIDNYITEDLDVIYADEMFASEDIPFCKTEDMEFKDIDPDELPF